MSLLAYGGVGCVADPIYVDFEYGDLKEVILGRGVMVYPDVDRVAWAAEALKVLPAGEAEKIRQRSGMDARDLPKYALVEQENDALAALLGRLGVIVHRPDELTSEQVAANYGRQWLANGYLQAYSRDPMFVVGDNVIELSPGTPNRRAELLGYRRLFARRVAGSGAKWVRMPLVDIARSPARAMTRAIVWHWKVATFWSWARRCWQAQR